MQTKIPFTVSYLVLYFILAACGTRAPLGGQAEHLFMAEPKRMILIQIPGLSAELLSLLKLSQSSAEWKSSWESAACTGQAWSFNLFSLRPSPSESSLATLLGSPNIGQDRCLLTEKVPLWSVMQAKGLEVHVVEREVPAEDSLLKFFDCPKGLWDRSKMTFWEMRPAQAAGEDFFHFQALKEYPRGQVYYDKTCGKTGCFAGLEQNLQVVFDQIDRKNKHFNFVLVRDWGLWNALQSKNIALLKQELAEWETLLAKLQARYLTDEFDGSILITGDSSVPVEVPHQGQEWREFLNSNKGLIFHRPSVYTPMWSWGARAENFCGHFSQSDFFKKWL